MISAQPRLRVGTIPSFPSIIAIRPPVLVPQMRSKYSQGLGTVSALVLRLICSIIDFRIKSEERPRTPPPSRERIDGVCAASIVTKLSKRRRNGNLEMFLLRTLYSHLNRSLILFIWDGRLFVSRLAAMGLWEKRCNFSFNANSQRKNSAGSHYISRYISFSMMNRIPQPLSNRAPFFISTALEFFFF